MKGSLAKRRLVDTEGFRRTPGITCCEFPKVVKKPGTADGHSIMCAGEWLRRGVGD